MLKTKKYIKNVDISDEAVDIELRHVDIEPRQVDIEPQIEIKEKHIKPPI